MKYCKRCYCAFYCLYIWLNICEYLCDIKIFRYTLCVKCHVILLCVMYKVYIIYFYCKNYVVSNVVSSHILCFLNLCHYKSSIEFLTLLVMKIYVHSIVSKSMILLCMTQNKYTNMKLYAKTVARDVCSSHVTSLDLCYLKLQSLPSPFTRQESP